MLGWLFLGVAVAIAILLFRLIVLLGRRKRESEAHRAHLEVLVDAQTEPLRKKMSSLERSYDITLEVFGGALDLKSAPSEGHSKRVTAFTIAIARALGLASEQIRVITRGAFFHDIGNMAIPDNILRKPGKLDTEEIAIMREHCLLGYQMVKKIPFLSESAEIVYSHHERYDGTGYPRGLRGEQIPPGARIFSIADALDAIMSDRPYRPARSFSAARKEILVCSGLHFDPEIVKVFLSMPENIWDDLCRKISALTPG